MTFRVFLWSIGVLSFGAIAVFLGTIFFVSPIESGIFGRVLFFGSAFFALLGTATILLSELYGRFSRTDMAHHSGRILRQGALIGGYLTGLLLFRYGDIFFWWTNLLLLAGFLLIELSCREWIDNND